MSNSINLECHYKIGKWIALGRAYECSVKNSLMSQEESTITSLTGTHLRGKCNDDVLAFYSHRKAGPSFPKGLQNYFKNLKAIHIRNSLIEEINQSDLSVFPDLIYLCLTKNRITVLEEGLFDKNSKLRVINLRKNKIERVNPHIFDNLHHLNSLYFAKNECINMDAEDDADEVQVLIENIRLECPSPNTESKINVDNKLSNNYEAMGQKIEDIKVSNAQINAEFNRKILALIQEIERLKLPNTHVNAELEQEISALNQEIEKIKQSNSQVNAQFEQKNSILNQEIERLKLSNAQVNNELARKTTALIQEIESLKKSNAQLVQKTEELAKNVNDFVWGSH